MLLKEFPDINMVRRLKNNTTPGADEWRNVVLNFECKEASRLAIESPYSLFLNNTGHSYCDVNKRQYRIETDTFLFTQPGDIYGLTVDNMHKTELCNIHISQRFFDGVAHSLVTTEEKLIDDPTLIKDAGKYIFTQLYPRYATLNRLTQQLTQAETYDSLSFDAVLAEVVAYLLLSGSKIQRSIGKLPFTKAAVRADIYIRLAIAKDYIHSNYNSAIDLDAICKETGMSKFHFLRVFKSHYGMTPYQDLSKVRMDKATNLLQSTSESITSISDSLGFEYPNSFIKAFQKTFGTSPLQYRKL